MLTLSPKFQSEQLARSGKNHCRGWGARGWCNNVTWHHRHTFTIDLLLPSLTGRPPIMILPEGRIHFHSFCNSLALLKIKFKTPLQAQTIRKESFVSVPKAKKILGLVLYRIWTQIYKFQALKLAISVYCIDITCSKDGLFKLSAESQ